jgi:hypothetical protein
MCSKNTEIEKFSSLSDALVGINNRDKIGKGDLILIGEDAISISSLLHICNTIKQYYIASLSALALAVIQGVGLLMCKQLGYIVLGLAIMLTATLIGIRLYVFSVLKYHLSNKVFIAVLKQWRLLSRLSKRVK